MLLGVAVLLLSVEVDFLLLVDAVVDVILLRSWSSLMLQSL